MLGHGRTFARRGKGRLSHRMCAPQDRPDIDRQPELAQAPGQALPHPAAASRRGAAWHGNQHHAITEDRREAALARSLQPHLGGEPRQPDRVRSLQARAQLSPSLTSRPPPTGKVREAGRKRQSRKRRGIVTRPFAPALIG